MKDDKPLDTDPENEDSEEEDFEEEDVDQEGAEDVASKMSLEELNTLAKREGDNAFQTKEDFVKHYANLNSLVGDQKRLEDEKKAKAEAEAAEKAKDENLTLSERLASFEARFEEDKFLTTNPDAKDSLDLVRSYSKDKGISLDEAWEKGGIKELTEAKKAREDETEIGVNSKNRLNSTEKKKIGKLATKVESGNASDAERMDLIRNFPGAL